MAAVVGKDTSVRMTKQKVLGMGTWSITGITVDLLEDTEFGDEWRTYLCGLKDGGEVSFSGYLDPACTSQNYLRSAMAYCSQLRHLRFYINEPSAAGGTTYYEPDSTGLPTGYSYVLITAWDINADKNGLVACSFTGKICGQMVKVG